MRQAVHRIAVGPRLRMRRDHGIDDGFLGRLHRPFKHGVHFHVRNRGDRRRRLLVRAIHLAGDGRKGHDQVPGARSRIGAEPSQPERPALRDAVKLVWRERSIRSDDDDDRSLIGERLAAASALGCLVRLRLLRVVTGQPTACESLSDRDACNAQDLSVAGVALNENANRIGLPTRRDRAR